MDIFVLGKRAAQWLSEQLLGPRGTRAEPVAPRLWRGPGSGDVICCGECDLFHCHWRCFADEMGGHSWVRIVECPQGCECPAPSLSCDDSRLDHEFTSACSVKCSEKKCTLRCVQEETGAYTWVVENKCPESCDCPTPQDECTAANLNDSVELVCIVSPPDGCVWECFGSTPTLEQVGCESAECCCRRPTCEGSGITHVRLPCECPPSTTTSASCDGYCFWMCVEDHPNQLLWALMGSICSSPCGCGAPPASPCDFYGLTETTPCLVAGDGGGGGGSGGGGSGGGGGTGGGGAGGGGGGWPSCEQFTCSWECKSSEGLVYWERTASCPEGCACNDGVPPPEEECVCATVGQVRMFTCHLPTTTSSTTTTSSSTTTTETTTTSAGCLAHFCNYYCVGGVWTLSSHDCPTDCYCPTLISPCSSGDGPVSSNCRPTSETSTTTTSTTTTSSTTTSGTTTTDTTTSQDCTSSYCYAWCQTDGQGNYYWEVLDTCPSGCQCRPDWYLVCDEANLGRHTPPCDY
jgi:hypothetical protein